ncbi:Flp pilus assembly protein CpaB [Candidatus Raskinella chloraquaticus]|uniref:SAF domain-containing protein n=1 Tax=Candidatus Raskinella chloraquaticus TaxID=1951219 RepID=A0A1W9HPX7_9HYPH|nr:MAG: hypothetical protein A4S15_01685 [Proteobacteria bacterium SG_bin8]
MKPAHIVVAAIAVGAGILAAMLAGSGSREPAVVEVAAPPPAPPSAEVLIAVGSIPVGGTINAGNVDWRKWPADAIGPYFVQRSVRPQAREELTGSIVRSAVSVGEPINSARIITGTRSGYMAAILPTGRRAFTVAIEKSDAGVAGFVLPNDRVDVLLTKRDRSGGQETFVTDTVLTNIRVLAIEQNVQEREGEKVLTGRTATLELDPRQTETMALSKQLGEISLALRSLADGPASQGDGGETADIQQRGGSMTIIRYGVTVQVPLAGK